MSMLNDPSMKEIILDFCAEAEALFDQLEQSLEMAEENPANTKELEKFVKQKFIRRYGLWILILKKRQSCFLKF